MLWYRAWLETRMRFLISLAGITGICGYRVFDLTRGARPFMGMSYYFFILRSSAQLLTVLWLVATTMLIMGGLLQERSAGVSWFTLGLPVTRARVTSVRICLGLLEAGTLVLVPWAAMFAAEVLAGGPAQLAQIEFYAVLLASGGAVFMGTSLLISSLVEGTFTAPMLSLGVIVACANAPKSFQNVNPLDFIDGSGYMGHHNVFTGPMPWLAAASYLCVTAILAFASVKVIERRDL